MPWMIWRRISRGAGAWVRDDVLLASTAFQGIDFADGRKIKVTATGLPIQNWIPTAVDVTTAWPLHAGGTPITESAPMPGLLLWLTVGLWYCGGCDVDGIVYATCGTGQPSNYGRCPLENFQGQWP